MWPPTYPLGAGAELKGNAVREIYTTLARFMSHRLSFTVGDSVSAFWVKLGANHLNCVDVPLNPTHSLKQFGQKQPIMPFGLAVRQMVYCWHWLSQAAPACDRHWVRQTLAKVRWLYHQLRQLEYIDQRQGGQSTLTVNKRWWLVRTLTI